MRLHAYLTQALLPTPPVAVAPQTVKFAQLPKISEDEVKGLAPGADGFAEFVSALEEKGDARARDAKKAVDRWGRLEVVDLAFKGDTSPLDAYRSPLLTAAWDSYWRADCYASSDRLPCRKTAHLAAWLVV
jgi:hypothetical protein